MFTTSRLIRRLAGRKYAPMMRLIHSRLSSHRASPDVNKSARLCIPISKVLQPQGAVPGCSRVGLASKKQGELAFKLDL